MSDRELLTECLEALTHDAAQRTFAGGVRMSQLAIKLRAHLAAPRPEPVFDGQSGHPVMLPRAPVPVLGLISDEARAALKAADAVESQEAYRTRAVAPEPESKTPAWWMDGLAATLMREGVNKHRAKEIAVGYWEAYCQIPGQEEDET